MERIKLKNARLERGLSQPELADEIGCSLAAISLWERGETDPQGHWILVLCTYFGKMPAELDLAKSLSESELAMLQEILKNRTVDRRQTLELLALPAFANVDLSSLSKPLVSPEQFLSQCQAAISACWQLLKHGDYNAVQALLHENTTTLFQLANTESEHQKTAASLAVQAHILHVQLATTKLDFTARETHCLEAVRFGRISGNPFALATAQCWQGDTFIYCYRQPHTAIPIFENALAGITSEATLNKCSIYSKLSTAYAQLGDETKARDFADKARGAMPGYPELQPFSQCLPRHSELDQFEGRMYLYLAEHFPDSDYAQQAYNAFYSATDKQARTKSMLGQAYIRRADTARILGDMPEFVKCLTRGATIAFQIDSPSRKSQARQVLDKTPEAWRNEQKYKDLAKMF